MTQQKRSAPLSRRAVVGTGLAVLAATAAGGGWVFWSRPSFAGSQLSPRQAFEAAREGSIFLVDIRRPDEWKATGIPDGAHPIDMRRKDFIAALDAVTGARKSAAIALICARGVRSAYLSNILTQAGYSSILNVPEGMLGSRAGPGWLESNLPVRPFAG